MVTGQFFIALRLWQRYKRWGLWAKDWRDLKLAQARVIELFDEIAANARSE